MLAAIDAQAVTHCGLRRNVGRAADVMVDPILKTTRVGTRHNPLEGLARAKSGITALLTPSAESICGQTKQLCLALDALGKSVDSSASGELRSEQVPLLT